MSDQMTSTNTEELEDLRNDLENCRDEVQERDDQLEAISDANELLRARVAELEQALLEAKIGPKPERPAQLDAGMAYILKRHVVQIIAVIRKQLAKGDTPTFHASIAVAKCVAVHFEGTSLKPDPESYETRRSIQSRDGTAQWQLIFSDQATDQMMRRFADLPPVQYIPVITLDEVGKRAMEGYKQQFAEINERIRNSFHDGSVLTETYHSRTYVGRMWYHLRNLLIEQLVVRYPELEFKCDLGDTLVWSPRDKEFEPRVLKAVMDAVRPVLADPVSVEEKMEL